MKGTLSCPVVGGEPVHQKGEDSGKEGWKMVVGRGGGIVSTGK